MTKYLDYISHLILYNIPDESILSQIGSIFLNYLNKNKNGVELFGVKRDMNLQMRRLIELALKNNFSGSIWENYLTWLILKNENPFSLTCESGTFLDKNITELAKRDFDAFKKLFELDFKIFDKISGVKNFNFKIKGEKNLIGEISDKLASAKNSDEMLNIVKDFYETRGVGDFGFYSAFRLKNNILLEPIINVESVSLDDIIGCEIQKRELRFNTEAFISGRPANNVLLYGDSGTGKSTSIKALINDYKDTKLKMIEIYKHQFKFLPDLISKIKNRNYKFIIFIDDLSFEESETEYKFLKAVIEGGLEVRPKNILIYATSNRRHIVREVWGDRGDMEHSGDVHRSDTLEEKLSLASRFGLAINYSAPNRSEYHEIVKNLAEKIYKNKNKNKNLDELLKGADTWEIRHGGKSGRTARQYLDYLAGNAN